MFKPYIGPEFGKPDNALGGVKLMVLGESHHAKGEDYPIGSTHPEFTRDVVADYKVGEHGGRLKFFDLIASAIGGTSKAEGGHKQMIAVWDSIAFYNYVPVIMAQSAQAERPTTEMWNSGVEPFQKVVAEVGPSVILVTGHHLWDEVVFRHAASEYHRATDPSSPYFPLADVGGVVAMKMLHPSYRGYSPIEYRPLIAILLERWGHPL